MDDSDFSIPNFSQTIDKRVIVNIFESCRYRSPLIVLCLRQYSLAIQVGTKLANGSGTIVYYIRDGNDLRSVLYNTFRTVSTQLLLGTQIVVIVTATKSELSTGALRSICWSFRGAFIELRNMASEDIKVQDKVNMLVDLAPLCNIPHCGRVYYGPTLFSELLTLSKKNKTKWYATIDYSMYTRSMLMGFSRYLFDNLYGGNSPNQRRVFVVGYNPPYVWAGLKHGLSVTYIERSVPSPGGKGLRKLIFPRIRDNPEANKVKYVIHNPQLKLLCQDMLMLTVSMNVLYIGAYPANHLEDLDLRGWKLIFVDPKGTQDWLSNMRAQTGANITMVDSKFNFDSMVVPQYVSQVFGDESYVIIDDSWVEGEDEYEIFQVRKQTYFEWIISDSSRHVVLIMMKWNRKFDVMVNYLIGLMAQPYGANLHELRAFFHKSGAMNQLITKKESDEYLERFSKISTASQIATQVYLHQFLITTKDALNFSIPEHSIVVASYSLSNSGNKKTRVLGYLKNINMAKQMLIFGAPNLNRVRFMLYCGLILDSHISIDNDLITFKNPTGKHWKDYGYTAVELLQNGFIEVTVDQMAGLASNVYQGCGYYANSNYNDIFSWYIPIWYVDRYLTTQNISTSPANVVKCFTTKIRNLCYVPHRVYYAYRAHLVGEFFALNNILNTDYILTGDGESTVKILNGFTVPHDTGPLTFSAGDVINVSGHLLSLGIAAHFIASPIYLWIKQMKYMSQDRKMEPGVDPLLYFDNKLSVDNTTLQRWHTREEVILASVILNKYVDMMLNGHYSFSIVSEIVDAVNTVFKNV